MSLNQRQIEEIIDQWSDDDEADGEQDPYESSDDELFDYVPELTPMRVTTKKQIGL